MSECQERWTAGSALKSEFIKKHGRFGRQAVVVFCLRGGLGATESLASFSLWVWGFGLEEQGSLPLDRSPGKRK